MMTIFRANGVQERVKVLDLSHFLKNSNLGKIIQTMFLSANILSLVKISSKLDHLWWMKGLRKPQKGHFMGAEWVPKTWKVFNLTTTNTILMKLTKIFYLHSTFNWRGWGGGGGEWT